MVAPDLKRGRWAKIAAFVVHEFRQALPPTIFFFIGFNLILFTKRLMLADYLVEFSGFFLATMSALVVGKTVLVADKLPFLRRFDRAPLIRPILFKTVVYTFLVLVARLLEALVQYLFAGGGIGDGGFVQEIAGAFSWHHFAAVQIWIFVLFLIYVTASEISNLLGDGELYRIFFRRPSPQLKAVRRARIRLLVQLSQLMEAHPLEVLNETGSAPHARLVSILRDLGRVEPVR